MAKVMGVITAGHAGEGGGSDLMRGVDAGRWRHAFLLSRPSHLSCR